MRRKNLPDLSEHAQRGARFEVHVTPSASAEAVAWGKPIRVRVTEAPSQGHATDAARKLLAAALGVAPSRLRLVYGSTAHAKLFELD